MKKLFAIFLAIFAASTAFAQAEKSIIIDQNTFRPVQKDALTGVNIDPIELDSSKRPCARLKVKINRMTREEINAIDVKIITNNQLTKNKTAEYDNGLILELTAKPQTRFYFHHDEFGDSNEVCLNLEADKEYYLEAYLNQQYPITVASNIEGADVYLDNVFKGQTGSDFVLVVKEVVPGNHTLRVEYGGVKLESEIFVSAGNVFFRQTVNVEASKPQFVVFAVEPQTAVVIIDNQHYSLQDGAMQVVLNNGTYNYTVTAAGYHPQSGTFTVAGSKVMKSINLSADAAMVSLTAPDNAEIWVNGSKKGVGSWSGSLVSGAYIFEARKAGHKSGSISQQITSTQPQQSYTLPAPTPVYGSLIVSGTPIMADVTIDGKPVGQTPLQLSNILTGEHSVTVSKSGYADFTQRIVVAEGKTETVTATLSKQTAQSSGSSSNIGNIEMVFVKGGTFTMGATAEQGSDADSDEKPTHQVTLSDFYIGKYEVTQAQWRAVMGSNQSYFKGDNLPVGQVSWNNIQEFITKLNAKTGKKFRLPTEAEWEYAARGGNKSQGYKYSGSNNIDNVAWYNNNSGGMTHPVGQKQPNELGLYDMSGNVWEWCYDRYGGYSSNSQTNPTGPNSGSRRVLRGGSWYGNARYSRNSYRVNGSTGDRGGSHGFRLACSVE